MATLTEPLYDSFTKPKAEMTPSAESEAIAASWLPAVTKTS
ncbi:hypothetical protein [Streptomyces sp. NPDC001410]